MCEKKITIQS